MTIQSENSYVILKYMVRLENGEIVKGDPEEGLAHMEFVTGYNQVIPGLERRVIGLSQGDEAEITVNPDEGFGPYDPDQIQEKTFAEFPEGKDLEEGRWALATNPQHRVTFGYLVLEKKPDSIVLDYNHPLAGKTLIYQVKVEKAREANREELEILRPCEFGEAGSPPMG
ncbi:MAG: peptidylprolyl isomerase [Deltaproteobacteria bacterium]|nr:MAG: peptidylprolyl isomerase [Deltaproteobacteria bacterium]